MSDWAPPALQSTKGWTRRCRAPRTWAKTRQGSGAGHKKDAVEDRYFAFSPLCMPLGSWTSTRGDKEADVTSSEHTALAAEISAAGHVYEE